MGILQVKDDKIILRRRDEIAVIEPFGRDILRFRSSRSGRLVDEDWTLLPQDPVPVETKLQKDRAVITNGIISAELYDSGKVVYYKHGRELLAERSEMVFSVATGNISMLVRITTAALSSLSHIPMSIFMV